MTKQNQQQQHRRGKSLSALRPLQRHIITGSQSPLTMRSSLLFDPRSITRQQPPGDESSIPSSSSFDGLQPQVMIPFQPNGSRQRFSGHSSEIHSSGITDSPTTSLSDDERLFNALQLHSASTSEIRRGRVPLAMRLNALPPRPKPPPESCLPALPSSPSASEDLVDLCESTLALSPLPPIYGCDINTVPCSDEAPAMTNEEYDVTVTLDEQGTNSVERATKCWSRSTKQIFSSHEAVQRAKSLLNRLSASPFLIQWALCSLDALNSHCQEEALGLVDTLLTKFQEADIDVEEAHWTIKAVTDFVEETTMKAAQIDEMHRRQSLDLFESSQGASSTDGGGLYRAKRIREIVKRQICAHDEFEVWAAWKRIEHGSLSARKEIGESELLTANRDIAKSDEIDYDERQHKRHCFLQQYRARYRQRQVLRQSVVIEAARPLYVHLAEARGDARDSSLEDWSCLDLPSIRHRLPLVKKETKEKLAMYEGMLEDAHAKIEELRCRVSVLERAAVMPRSPTSTSSASAYSTFSATEGAYLSHDSASTSSASDTAKAKFFDGVLFAMATPPRSKRHHRKQSDLPQHML